MNYAIFSKHYIQTNVQYAENIGKTFPNVNLIDQNGSLHVPKVKERK